MPVSIGGLLAWIIRLERNNREFVGGDRDAKGLGERTLNRVRNLTAKRDRVARQRRTDLEEQTAGRRKRERAPTQESSSGELIK